MTYIRHIPFTQGHASPVAEKKLVQRLSTDPKRSAGEPKAPRGQNFTPMFTPQLMLLVILYLTLVGDI